MIFNSEFPNVIVFCLLQGYIFKIGMFFTPLENPCKNGRSDSTPKIISEYQAFFLDFTMFESNTQCPRTDLNKRFLPKPMTTTG